MSGVGVFWRKQAILAYFIVGGVAVALTADRFYFSVSDQILFSNPRFLFFSQEIRFSYSFPGPDALL